jgi:hypothetical protein
MRIGGRGLARLAGVLLIPYARFVRAMIVGQRKGYRAVLVRTWHLILWLYLVQAASLASSPGQVTVHGASG